MRSFKSFKISASKVFVEHVAIGGKIGSVGLPVDLDGIISVHDGGFPVKIPSLGR